jgi:hypothetical protein
VDKLRKALILALFQIIFIGSHLLRRNHTHGLKEVLDSDFSNRQHWHHKRLPSLVDRGSRNKNFRDLLGDLRRVFGLLNLDALSRFLGLLD